jgi:hypothetical protein
MEFSRSGAEVSEPTPASGNFSARMRVKRERNCSQVMRPASRGESVSRNSRRPGLARPKRRTSRTMRSPAASLTRGMRRVRLRSSDQRCTRGFLRATRSSKCSVASSASHSPSSRTATLPEAARSLSARSSAAPSFASEFNGTPSWDYFVASKTRAAAIASYCKFRPVTRMEGYS